MFILFCEALVPLTKAQKENGVVRTFTVDRVKSVATRLEADLWVNRDSEHRSWSNNE